MAGLAVSFPLEIGTNDPECSYVTPPVGLGHALVPCPFLAWGLWQVQLRLKQLTAPDGPRDRLPIRLHRHPPLSRYPRRFPRGRTWCSSFFGSKWPPPTDDQHP